MALNKPYLAARLGLTALGALATATSVFALDEYLPLAPRVMEIDIGLERGSQNGYFDRDGEAVAQEEENNPLAIPLQGKFGMVDGLEASLGVNYIGQNTAGHAGFDRPLLALKYAHPTHHLGGFLGISLPIGFTEIMESGNYASILFGALYGLDLPKFRLLSNASYTYNTVNEDNTKEDQIHVFVKPEYPIPVQALIKRKQYLGLYLGINYDVYLNNVVADESIDGSRYLFSLMPGINYTFNKIISSELTVNYPVKGESGPAPFTTFDVPSLKFQIYFTLEETLYNALSG